MSVKMLMSSVWTVTIATFVGAVAGCLVNIYFVYHLGVEEKALTNHYLGLYACAVLLFVSLQSLIYQSPEPPPANPLLIRSGYNRETFLRLVLGICLLGNQITMLVFVLTTNGNSFLELPSFIVGIVVVPFALLFYLFHVDAYSQFARSGLAYSSLVTITEDSLHILLTALFLLSSVMWSYYGRTDLTVWFAFAAVMSLTNAILVITRPAERRMEAKLYRGNSRQQLLLQQQRQKLSCYAKMSIATDMVVKVAVLLLSLLLANSAVLHGTGTQKYPPLEGKFLDFMVPGGVDHRLTQRIYYRCQGAKTSLPTLIFESDGSHGVGDWLGILNAMAHRHRVCVWDKPGLGWSDYMMASQVGKDSDWYFALIDELVRQEPDFGPPYIFVGWGGGGPLSYQYAMDYPDMVDSMVMLDVALDGSEWRLPATLQNWTQDQYDDYVQQDLTNRFKIFAVINGLGVPLGLIPPFFPQSKVSEFWPPEDVEEKDWYFLTEKTWITQKWYLTTFSGNVTNIFEEDINKDIPVHALITHRSDEQVERLTCQPNQLNATECEYEKELNRLMLAEMLTVPRNGGKVVECNMDECGLGYYVFDDPGFTVEAILGIYGVN